MLRFPKMCLNCGQLFGCNVQVVHYLKMSTLEFQIVGVRFLIYTFSIVLPVVREKMISNKPFPPVDNACTSMVFVVSGGIASLIDGSYEYYHYLLNGMDDSVRSLSCCDFCRGCTVFELNSPYIFQLCI